MLDTIEQALTALRQGKMILVVDDEDRENEGDLIACAGTVTPEQVNFMAAEGRGLICVALPPDRASQLGLRTSAHSDALHGTAFTDSVDLIAGTTTGISAADRALTCQALADPGTRPQDLARPGHVFPLVARQHGVLERRGHTEATVDLCRLAGQEPVGLLCEVLNPDGSMARLPQLRELARRHDLPLISVEQLVQWRRKHEILLDETAAARLPLPQGQFTLHQFAGPGAKDPLGLRKTEGDGHYGVPPLVRVHSECLTGDLFASRRCDCGPQLELALEKIGQEEQGAVLYLRQEGRGIGLAAKLQAYNLQDHGLDTWDANTALGLPADARDYWEAAQILKLWGWTEIRLLTNNPAKVAALEAYGITVSQVVPLEVLPQPENRAYLETKRLRFGHQLTTMPQGVMHENH